MCSRSVAVLLGVWPPTLSAQTFVVDQANGPGTNFTSLPAAAAAVPDGAVLLVRPGTYAGFSISGKGLVVLGDPGVDLSGGIAVMVTAPHQKFVLRNVSWSAPPANAPCVRVESCAGPVVLEGLTNTGWPLSFPTNPHPLRAVNCGQLVLRESSLAGYVWFDGVTAAIERCTLTGSGVSGFFWPSSTNAGLTARQSSVQIVGSTLRGGDGYGSGPAASLAASEGTVMLSSSLRMIASTSIGGIDGAGQRYALSGLSATARLDPLTVLQGGLQPWGITAQILPMPRLTTYGAPLGGTLRTTVSTLNGDLVVLVVGLPGSPTTLAGFQDAFWLDPNVHVFHAIGVQQQGAPVVGTVPVPNAPGFAGLHLVWHAACFGPVTGQQDTMPGISLIR